MYSDIVINGKRLQFNKQYVLYGYGWVSITSTKYLYLAPLESIKPLKIDAVGFSELYPNYHFEINTLPTYKDEPKRANIYSFTIRKIDQNFQLPKHKYRKHVIHFDELKKYIYGDNTKLYQKIIDNLKVNVIEFFDCKGNTMVEMDILPLK